MEDFSNVAKLVNYEKISHIIHLCPLLYRSNIGSLAVLCALTFIFERCLFNVLPLKQAYFFTVFPALIESGISETLSLGEKSLSLAKNPFIFMGEIWNFP